MRNVGDEHAGHLRRYGTGATRRYHRAGECLQHNTADLFRDACAGRNDLHMDIAGRVDGNFFHE